MSDERFKLPPDTKVYENSAVNIQSDNVPNLYHVTQMKAPEVHARNFDGRGVKIAFLDTGYTPHKFLPEPVFAQSFVPGESVRDGHGHGNHVIGTGSGRRGANGASLGIAPGSDAMALKCLSNGGSGDTRWIRAAMLSAAKAGADILSMSLGDNGGPVIPEDIRVIEQCYELGVLSIVVAAGNAGFNGTRNTIGRIASYEGHVTCVGALMQNGSPAPFSSGGPAMQVMGYGSRIVSAGIRGSDLITMDGTSMACPGIAGCKALIVQWHRAHGIAPPRGYKEWDAYFAKFSKDLGRPGKDPATGWGIPELLAALDSLKPLENV